MKITISINEVSTEIDSDVLSHIFVAHSLNLHNWAKKEKEKLIEFIGKTGEYSDRNEGIQKMGWYYDTLTDIVRRREQSQKLETVFKEQMLKQH